MNKLPIRVLRCELDKLRNRIYSIAFPFDLNVEFIYSEFDSLKRQRRNNALFLLIHPINPLAWVKYPQLSLQDFLEQSDTPFKNIGDLATTELVNIELGLHTQFYSSIKLPDLFLPFVLIPISLKPWSLVCITEVMPPEVPVEYSKEITPELPVKRPVKLPVEIPIEIPIEIPVEFTEVNTPEIPVEIPVEYSEVPVQFPFPYKRLKFYWYLNEVLPPPSMDYSKELMENNTTENISTPRYKYDTEFAALENQIKAAIRGVSKGHTITLKVGGTGYSVRTLSYEVFMLKYKKCKAFRYIPTNLGQEPITKEHFITKEEIFYENELQKDLVLDVAPVFNSLAALTEVPLDMSNVLGRSAPKMHLICNMDYNSVRIKMAMLTRKRYEQCCAHVFLLFSLGFSHEVLFIIPPTYYPSLIQLEDHKPEPWFVECAQLIGGPAVTAKLLDKNSVQLTAANYEVLLDIVTEIYSLKPPEPYKGNGIFTSIRPRFHETYL